MTNAPKDLRRYAQSTMFRLTFGGVILTVLGGTAAVAWIYGGGAAGMALLCFAAALLPVGLIILFLAGIQWIVNRARSEE